MVSINTNVNQLSALQLLRANGEQSREIETRLATGLKIASAKDNGATWGMAVQAKSTEGAYEVLDDARDHAISLVDVTLSATDAVSDLVDRMNALALAAMDSSLPDTARASLNNDYQALKRQIDRGCRVGEFRRNQSARQQRLQLSRLWAGRLREERQRPRRFLGLARAHRPRAARGRTAEPSFRLHRPGPARADRRDGQLQASLRRRWFNYRRGPCRPRDPDLAGGLRRPRAADVRRR